MLASTTKKPAPFEVTQVKRELGNSQDWALRAKSGGGGRADRAGRHAHMRGGQSGTHFADQKCGRWGAGLGRLLRPRRTRLVTSPRRRSGCSLLANRRRVQRDWEHDNGDRVADVVTGYEAVACSG